jgi:serine/threonine-protein kinase ATR
LLSRVDQPKPLGELLFSLIQASLLDYPQATLWHLMYVHNTSPGGEKFSVIWEECRKKMDRSQRERMDSLRDCFRSLTKNLIAFIDAPLPSTDHSRAVRADTLCPRLFEDFKGSRILLPRSRSLILNPESPEFKDPSKYDSANLMIERMEPEVKPMPSLQRPKRIGLRASNGIAYYFLCKEDGDLRKDMRMMEFASFVNLILGNDRRCRERALHLQTFAVVCLNARMGMIEWIEHTTSLQVVIEEIYKKKKIRIDHGELKNLFPDEQPPDADEQMKVRIANFNQTLLKYPAVLHMWFIDRFRDLAEWFQARVTFTRSTAVWSMIGWVVGLGDRHPGNLLLGEDDGRWVHVDFACIFDHAKNLPVPETVPFRMTQNILDGMGILKENGGLKPVCELVLAMLSAKREKLVAVLRPFLYDPLLDWAKLGKATAEQTAKLTLQGVSFRLKGFSDDRSAVNSPECTVNRLIEDATNPANLARLFRGWQPFI